MPKHVRTMLLHPRSIFWLCCCPIPITVAVTAKGNLSSLCSCTCTAHSSSNPSITCPFEMLNWSHSQGQQQNSQVTLEQDETSHDNFGVCLHIETKGNYFFLIGDTSLSPKQWERRRKKKTEILCESSTRYSNGNSLYKNCKIMEERLSRRLCSNNIFNFFYIISIR